jgi:hypothetical protein
MRLPLPVVSMLLLPLPLTAGNLDHYTRAFPAPICGVSDDFSVPPEGMIIQPDAPKWSRWFPFKSCQSILTGMGIGVPNPDTRSEGRRALDELMAAIGKAIDEKTIKDEMGGFTMPCKAPPPPRGLGFPSPPHIGGQDLPVCTRPVLEAAVRQLQERSFVRESMRFQRLIDGLDLQETKVVEALNQTSALIIAAGGNITFAEVSDHLEASLGEAK